ncbi:MAG: transposase [Bryobacteraceae bacterium]
MGIAIQQDLLAVFDQLVSQWAGRFSQQRIFDRVRRLSLGMLVSLRLHLTSQAICVTGRQFQDWTSDYRVCSQSPWEARELFNPVLDALPGLLHDEAAPVLVALDDTLLRKTGRKIPGVTLGRDPMSPPFHVNLCYGLRFVQASALVYPRQGGAARALPVRFEFAPPAVKPKSMSRKKAEPKAANPTVGAAQDHAPCKASKAPLTAEEIAYSEEKKLKRLPQVGLNTIRDLRDSLDKRAGLRDRQLIVSGDASYTTRVVLQGLPKRTTYIGRIRKDAKLYWPVEAETDKTHQPGRPRRYGALAPTPEQLLKDDTPWISVGCFVAGQTRDISVKTLGPVYWRNAGVDIPLRVVVIKPPGYRSRKGGKLHYRQPAFLICTELTMGLDLLVQAYLYRWEIECNHRDEKSLLGVGQGQVRNCEAVRRLPQLQVAGYSLLLLASLLSSGFQRDERQYLPLPKWRRLAPGARPSLLDMLNLLRNQIFARNLHSPLVDIEGFMKNAPESVKPSKLPLTPEMHCTLAA